MWRINYRYVICSICIYFPGTRKYFPPEWFSHKKYQASPTTTWSLGVLLFELVCGDLPFEGEEEIIFKQPLFVEGLSKGKGVLKAYI